MKRLIVGFLSIMLLASFFIGCTNDRVSDSSGYITFREGQSRGLSSSVGEAPGVESLVWTYTAIKKDNGFNTGEATAETLVKKDKTTGIADVVVGPFSVGQWSFTLKGYVDYGEETEALVYIGTNDEVEIQKGTGNVVKVTVEYQGLEGNGTLTFTDIYINDADSGERITKEASYVTVSNGSSELVTFESNENGQLSSEAIELKAGVYTLSFVFYDCEGNEAAAATKTVFILNQRETVVKGDVNEKKNSGSFDIVIDESTRYYTLSYVEGKIGNIYITPDESLITEDYSKDQLYTDALKAAIEKTKELPKGANIYLNEEVTLTEALDISNVETLSRAVASTTTIIFKLSEPLIAAGDKALFNIGEGFSFTINGSNNAALITTGETVLTTESVVSISGIKLEAKSVSEPVFKASGEKGKVSISNSEIGDDATILSDDATRFTSNNITSNNVENLVGIVATIEGTNIGYSRVENALSSAKDGETVRLINDYTEADPSGSTSTSIANKNITLDLQGHTYVAKRKIQAGLNGILNVVGKGKLEFQSFKIKSTTYTSYFIMQASAEKPGTLNIRDGVTVISDYTCIDFKPKYHYGAVVNIENAKVVSTTCQAINVLGTITDTANPLTINITNSTIEGSLPIYQAGYSIVNIKDSTLLGEQSGAEIRAGILNISGASVLTSNSNAFGVTANGSGSTICGAGLGIAQHTTKLPLEVTIEGGTFTGIYGLYEHNIQNNSEADIAKVQLAISNGTFIGSEQAIYSEDKTGFITNGLFSSDITDTGYLADGLATAKSDSDGYYSVVEKTYV